MKSRYNDNSCLQNEASAVKKVFHQPQTQNGEIISDEETSAHPTPAPTLTQHCRAYIVLILPSFRRPQWTPDYTPTPPSCRAQAASARLLIDNSQQGLRRGRLGQLLAPTGTRRPAQTDRQRRRERERAQVQAVFHHHLYTDPQPPAGSHYGSAAIVHPERTPV
ncbi:hypothetical protein SRHO_G00312950 [Serrasalmus rhombeus]